MLRIVAVAFLFISLAARAEEQGPPMPVPDPPDIPAPVASGEPMDPDVTIIRKGQESVEEFRVGNRLVRIRVTPIIGPPYYLMDTDGDGNMDVRRSDNERDLRINQWVLFSW
jgi:hypothetical protein